MQPILAILTCVILNSIAQILLKFGMRNFGKNLSLSITVIPSLISNMYVIFGAVLYAMSFILWLYVLSKVKVSYAYPFISLSYVLVAVLGTFMLGEKLTISAWLGICFVVIGVVLIGVSIGG